MEFDSYVQSLIDKACDANQRLMGLRAFMGSAAAKQLPIDEIRQLHNEHEGVHKQREALCTRIGFAIINAVERKS